MGIEYGWLQKGFIMTVKHQMLERNTAGLLTVPQFLQTYAITRSSFYREVNRGAIPLVKCGRSTRVAVADAEAWVANLPRTGGRAAND